MILDALWLCYFDIKIAGIYGSSSPQKWYVPSGSVKIAIENGPVEIVLFTSIYPLNMMIFHRYVSLPGGNDMG